jgi:hypothetical protein
MSKKLRLWLPDCWTNITDQNPDGPITVCLDDPAATGALQLSIAEYVKGAEPVQTAAELVELAESFGNRHRWGKLVSSSGSDCVMGRYGTAAFVPETTASTGVPAYQQVWFVSNGWDFVLITFISMSPLSTRELSDAQRIVDGVNLV